MSSESSYRIEVLESFQALQESLFQLQARMCLIDAHLPGWVDPLADLPARPNQSDRNNAFALINQLEYLDQQAPREILVAAGLFAASAETLEAIKTVNDAKDRFKAAIISLKTAKISIQDPYLTKEPDLLLRKRPESTGLALQKMGLSRLHLKQCYRRIPYFDKRPTKVSWTWANTRAITRLSFQQAEALLMKRSKSPAIEIQMNKLYTLNPQEPLARVQTLAPHLRVNVVFETSSDKQERIMAKGPIPVFYLSDDISLLPSLRPPGDKKGRDPNRPVRCDAKLEPVAFLPAIRVHRYQVF